MKKTYLFLTGLGFVLPNIFVIQESINTGNYLLYRYPLETFSQMFANNVSSAFITDLLFLVILFLVWSFKESKQHNIKGLGVVWLVTFAFGLAAGLPLFLYFREKVLGQKV